MEDDGTIFKLDIKEEALRELREDFHQPREKLEIYRADLEERFKKKAEKIIIKYKGEK